MKYTVSQDPIMAKLDREIRPPYNETVTVNDNLWPSVYNILEECDLGCFDECT